MQATFAKRAKAILEQDENVIGLAVVGSWLTNQIDEFSDLDLILVTQEKVAGNNALMTAYAKRLGDFLSGFTGEHVGEPRVLICLYDNPLLHVDIKFLTLEECHKRIETPVWLIDKGGQLSAIMQQTVASYPYPDYQWIEDRFWTWVHYALLKIGRGEYMEAFDFLGFLRMIVFGPLLHIKNGNLPRGVRKVETDLQEEDLSILISTIPTYNKISLLHCMRNSVALYRMLRLSLYDEKVTLQARTEEKVMLYLDQLE